MSSKKPHTLAQRIELYLTRIVQLLFALTFMVSGWAKCIDPAGTSIKVTEYLQYFGLGLFAELSMGFAWVLCILEFICGVQLLLGHARIFTLLCSSLLLLLFTPLTLWLALSDAIQDCGCFGDLIHLSNWHTFWKNVVLLAMLVQLWRRRRYLYNVLGGTAFSFCRYWAFFYCVWLCWYGTWREPLMDFRPYAPGTDLRQAVGIDPEEKGQTTYTCLYQRDGITQEFPLEALPDEAEGWEYVDTIEHAATEAATATGTAAAHSASPFAGKFGIDLYLKTLDGEEVTQAVLGEAGYTLLLLSPSLDKASQHDIDRIEALSEYAYDHEYPFYCVTARDTAQLNRWLHTTGAEYQFLFTDITVIQTICRSNPGVMLLRDGVICWKRPLSVIDTQRLTSAKLIEQTDGEIEENDLWRQFLWLVIWLFAPFVVFLLFEIPKKILNYQPKKDSKDA